MSWFFSSGKAELYSPSQKLQLGIGVMYKVTCGPWNFLSIGFKIERIGNSKCPYENVGKL